MHPVFVTFYGVLFITVSHVVAVSRMPENWLFWFLAMVFLSMTVIPMLALGILFRRFTAREWEAMPLNERSASAIAMGIIYIALYFSYRNFEPDPLIGIFIISAAVASILAGLLQKWIRLSFHAMSMAGVLVVVLFMARNGVSLVPPAIPVSIILLLTGLVAWSRLSLNAHRPVEIYLGYSVGLLCTTAVLVFQYGL